MGKKFFVFDFDGSLVNNTQLGFRKIRLGFQSLGLIPPTIEDMKKHWGHRHIYDVLGHNHGASEAQIAALKAMDNQNATETPDNLDRLIIHYLNKLKKAGHLAGLLTSRPENGLRHTAKLVELDLKVFDFLHHGESSEFVKPDGRVFDPALTFADKFGIAPQDIIYFGDTVDYDLAAVRSAIKPISFIAVSSGVNSRLDFINAGHPLKQCVCYHGLADFLATAY